MCGIWRCGRELSPIQYVMALSLEMDTLIVRRMVKGIFVIRDRPPFFPVKCEMAIFFLVNRDFYSSREPCFSKIIFCEMRNKCLFRREP